MAPKNKNHAYHQVAKKPQHPNELVQQWIDSNPKTLYTSMLDAAKQEPDPVEKQKIYAMLCEYVAPNLHRAPNPNAPTSIMEHKILGRDPPRPIVIPPSLALLVPPTGNPPSSSSSQSTLSS